MGRGATIEFILKYKELKCLWNVSHSDYQNKKKRLDAKKQLLEILRKTESDANLDTVTKKIYTLRSSFNKEHNKVKSSYLSGTSPHDIHVPKLWYYNMLTFLSDRDNESRKPNDSDSVLIETIITEPMNLQQEAEKDSLQSQSSVSSNKFSQDINDYLNIKIENSASEILSRISNRLDSYAPKRKPQYSAFGEHVAEKLRALPSDMAAHCTKLINDAIYHADFGTLNYTSRIVTE